MQAWRVHELGEPIDVLRLDEVDPPVPPPGHVVVEVAAAALNFPDILLCKGEYQEKPALPFTPGVEMAGTVVEVGEGVDGLAPGDRVLGAPTMGPGGLAERTVAPAAALYPVPAGMSWTSAAALHVTYQTGWVALHTRAHIQPGETLLVHAGAGGVGSAAIQLGQAAGARVVATAGGADKVKVLHELGVDLAVDYRADDFVEAVKEFTDGRGADVVYDPVGGDVFDKSTKCIAFEGRLLVIGFTSGRIPQARANHVLVKNYSVVGVHWGLYNRRRPEVPRQAHEALTRLYADGLIDPLVSQVVPFDQAPAALVSLGGRGTYGKVVVDVASG
ncbi:MAG TPA: NADPH:quinone oxidoreductase family protein [Acidimicrobiales bacterium]|nr:NADPH:quinone oxidoreductase family protein [Acidimicrobiales bacterium]